MSVSNYSADEERVLVDDDGESRLLALVRMVIARLEPGIGWPVLLCTLALATIPGQAAEANEWIELPRPSGAIILLGPLAVVTICLLLGWKRVGSVRRLSKIRIAVLVLVTLVLGLIGLTQALVAWMPSPLRLIQIGRAGAWSGLGAQLLADLNRLGTRYVVWWQGVRAGGATQDDLVFAGLVGVALWLGGLLTGWLLRRYRRGLLVALPSLWLVSLALLYGTTGRATLVLALILAIVLHVLLHHRQLEADWVKRQIGQGTGILVDRMFYVVGVGAIIMALAAIMPSFSISAVTERYYRLISPINVQAEAFGERLFPELKASSRFRGSPVAGGMPNSFLLGAGPELSQRVVMRVRTDDAIIFEPEFLEEAPVQGHYTRGGTFAVYDGLGWENPRDIVQSRQLANDPVFETNMEGRKLLRQDIFPAVAGQALYAAPEPLEPALDYRVDLRANGDIVALWARASSYTIVSAIPAVSQSTLEANPGWSDEMPLPEDYQLHLALPDTITERTQQLARDLTAGLDGPYAKAQALEAHLRTLEYDLTVSKPPSAVTDVADYFLFDLQRGYCDYYTTAFAVMARAIGLPTRFATGFAVGHWNGAEGLWVITEAEAHSWPEVYFPQIGWIPFEPTAGRPELVRVGLPEPFEIAAAPVSNVAVPEEPEATSGITWNWQMLVWLLPLGLLGWGLFQLLRRWQPRQEDPWQGLLRWGQRMGRPLGAGETVLEYGSGLADHTLVRYATREQDTGRTIAREVQALSEDVSTIRYGSEAKRVAATDEALRRWQSLRGYLRRFRL